MFDGDRCRSLFRSYHLHLVLCAAMIATDCIYVALLRPSFFSFLALSLQGEILEEASGGRGRGGEFWCLQNVSLNQTSIKCATARPSVIDSEGPSSIIKDPNIRSFVAKSVLARFTRFLGVRTQPLTLKAQTKHCQIGQLHY